MGYTELRLALREEAGRQLQEIERDSDERAAGVVAAARAAVDRERADAVAAAERAAAEEDGRALERQRLAVEGRLLVEARRLLAGLREEAAARLPAAVDGAAHARLAAELTAALDGDGWQLRDGGLVAARGGRTVDNRPESRLARAWPELEPELARLLLAEAP